METDKHPGSGVHAALAAAHQTDVRRNRFWRYRCAPAAREATVPGDKEIQFAAARR
ncbi:MAG: hypothetical protein ACLRWP_10535 [Bilophila wadsworthia]